MLVHHHPRQYHRIRHSELPHLKPLGPWLHKHKLTNIHSIGKAHIPHPPPLRHSIKPSQARPKVRRRVRMCLPVMRRFLLYRINIKHSLDLLRVQYKPMPPLSQQILRNIKCLLQNQPLHSPTGLSRLIINDPLDLKSVPLHKVQFKRHHNSRRQVCKRQPLLMSVQDLNLHRQLNGMEVRSLSQQ